MIWLIGVNFARMEAHFCTHEIDSRQYKQYPQCTLHKVHILHYICAIIGIKHALITLTR